MKNTTNFPYNVKVCSKNEPQLEVLEPDTDNLNYMVSIPPFVLQGVEYEQVKDKLELVAEVNCSSTMYRYLATSSNLESIKITVSQNCVFDSFGIDVIIVFKEEAQWDGLTMHKGMPVAHIGSFSVYLENRSQGLISFFPNEDKQEIAYSFNDNTIQINIPRAQFDWLLANQFDPLIKNLLSSQFAQIALIEACQKLKDSGNDHKMWYKELRNKWFDYTKDGREYPEDDEIVGFVNSILISPSMSLINYLIDYRNRERDE